MKILIGIFLILFPILGYGIYDWYSMRNIRAIRKYLDYLAKNPSRINTKKGDV